MSANLTDGRKPNRLNPSGQFTGTETDRFFAFAVGFSRWLSRLTSRVYPPDDANLPLDRPVILAANHSSLYDLPVALITIGKYGYRARIGVNARFFHTPLIGGLFRRMGCIPFSRQTRDESEATMVDALKAGELCAIMPEGKVVLGKDHVDGVGPGRLGVSRIARQAGAAVVPIGIAGASEAWRPGRPLMKLLSRKPVIVKIGPALDFTTDDHQANVEQLMEAIAGLVKAGNQERSSAS